MENETVLGKVNPSHISYNTEHKIKAEKHIQSINLQ